MLQMATLLLTVHQQHRELALMKEQLRMAAHSQFLAHSSDPAMSRDHQIQRDAYNRATLYCEQATASYLALDQATAACKQLQLQLSSANEAHTLEQQGLTGEVKRLRSHTAALDKKVSQLLERATAAEQQLAFSQEQLAVAREGSAQEGAALQQRILELNTRCSDAEQLADHLRDSAHEREARLERAESDLKTMSEEVRLSCNHLAKRVHTSACPCR
jgi:uncharacterized coiled-coil protein SlyX